MRDFHDLKVWEKAHQLVLALYKASACFPSTEIYGLTSQLRRAGVSIAANIAEGCGRSGRLDFARFLEIAMGSASEVEYHLLLSRDLAFLSDLQYLPLVKQVTEIKRMLTSFSKKLRADA
jgi:four helix bundle protein